MQLEYTGRRKKKPQILKLELHCDSRRMASDMQQVLNYVLKKEYGIKGKEYSITIKEVEDD